MKTEVVHSSLLPLLLQLLLLLHEASTSSNVPVITQHPLSTTVLRNEPLTLDCRYSSSSAANVTWFKDDVRVLTTADVANSHRILLPDGSLFFLRAMLNRREDDAGQYYCQVQNQAGSTTSKSANIVITYLRDDFRETPSNTDALVSSSVLLKCQPPRGHPLPTVTWLKDNESLTSSSRLQVLNEGHLRIDHVQLEDAGNYRCKAHNEADELLTQPVVLRVFEMPRIESEVSSVTALVGEDAFLECRAEGQPKLTWRRLHNDHHVDHDDDHVDLDDDHVDHDLLHDEALESGQVITSSRRVKLVPSKGLRIRNVQPFDTGHYQCLTSNPVGQDSHTITLEVLQTPSIVEEGREELDCSVQGIPTPTVFWTSGRNDGQRQAEKPKVLFKQEDTEDDDEDEYNVDDVIDVDHVLRNGSLYLGRQGGSSWATCFAVNRAGAAMKRVTPTPTPTWGGCPGPHLRSLTSLTPSSLRVTWDPSPDRLEALDEAVVYFVWYKESALPDDAFQFMEVSHHQTSFVLRHLRGGTDYSVFVQPVLKNVFECPSQLMSVETVADVPWIAPRLTDAHIVNDTSIQIEWEHFDQAALNGQLVALEVLVRSLSMTSSMNATMLIKPTLAKKSLVSLSQSLMPDTLYSLQVAAVNSVGAGPYSQPLSVSWSSSSSTSESDYKENTLYQLVLIALIVCVAALSLVLFCLALLMLHRRHFMIVRRGKLVAGDLVVADEFHHCHIRPKQANWEESKERSEYNEEGTETRLLMTRISPVVSDTEYTYVTSDNRRPLECGKKTSVEGSKRSVMDTAETAYASTDLININNNVYALPMANVRYPRLPLPPPLISSSSTSSTSSSTQHSLRGAQYLHPLLFYSSVAKNNEEEVGGGQQRRMLDNNHVLEDVEKELHNELNSFKETVDRIQDQQQQQRRTRQLKRSRERRRSQHNSNSGSGLALSATTKKQEVDDEEAQSSSSSSSDLVDNHYRHL